MAGGLQKKKREEKAPLPGKKKKRGEKVPSIKKPK